MDIIHPGADALATSLVILLRLGEGDSRKHIKVQRKNKNHPEPLSADNDYS